MGTFRKIKEPSRISILKCSSKIKWSAIFHRPFFVFPESALERVGKARGIPQMQKHNFTITFSVF
ncbi:hypothetical protein CH380_06610 [Leptospira adleri]|uniref:Uncharacterized protein n=1 Tax=Leptospira adleri TaxID=2023186 RepID=A0A2M9YRK7_9LEPT|nr:hypothetical protein CH380_06610 [Leptospira adleri]PJZ62645.1 hypothetical protein CH376_06590 [Leptospira adleri]